MAGRAAIQPVIRRADQIDLTVQAGAVGEAAGLRQQQVRAQPLRHQVVAGNGGHHHDRIFGQALEGITPLGLIERRDADEAAVEIFQVMLPEQR